MKMVFIKTDNYIIKCVICNNVIYTGRTQEIMGTENGKINEENGHLMMTKRNDKHENDIYG